MNNLNGSRFVCGILNIGDGWLLFEDDFYVLRGILVFKFFMEEFFVCIIFKRFFVRIMIC